MIELQVEMPYKALRYVEYLFIQRFLFIHPRFVFIVQGSLLVEQ